NRITVGYALDGLSAALAAHSLTPAQVIAVVTGMAAHVDAASQTAINSEIASLITSQKIPVDAALTALVKAASSNALFYHAGLVEMEALINQAIISPDNAVSFLGNLSGHGDANLQAAADTVVAGLVNDGAISANRALADITYLVASNAITSDQGLGV